MTRYDNKNRLLRSGEYQRPDGRYSYKYIKDGKQCFVYSWKLNSTDKVPTGKSDCESLREMERRINRDLEDNIDTVTSYETLDERFEKYMEYKKNLQITTRSGYMDAYNHHVKDVLGKRQIRSIKYSDIYNLYVSIIVDKGYKVTSMESVNTVLNPMFEIAVQDDILRKNPAKGVMKRVKDEYRKFNEPSKVRALTVDEQAELIKFLREDPDCNIWYPVVLTFLGSGLRCEELLALQWSDIDFDKKLIDINKVLIHRGIVDKATGKHKTQILISPYTKTINSRRTVPLTNTVEEALKIQMQYNQITKCTDEISGYNDFVFLNRFGKVLKSSNINKAIKRIARNHNKKVKMAEDDKELVLIPEDMHCHQFRHTYATRFAEKNPNVKLLMSILGHSDIRTTMQIYAEIDDKRKAEESENLDQVLMLEPIEQA